ncbi:hypothetical protein [Nonomuraea sp. NPDC050310]|uniref:hypothetical protein n=1 Tax=Nonomuraea sp. NPDC050310 TaxID=3154935 RepID=UPI0033C2378F
MSAPKKAVIAALVVAAALAAWFAVGRTSVVDRDAEIACGLVAGTSGSANRILAGMEFASAAAATDPEHRPLAEAFVRLAKAVTGSSAPDAPAIDEALAAVTGHCGAARPLDSLAGTACESLHRSPSWRTDNGDAPRRIGAERLADAAAEADARYGALAEAMGAVNLESYPDGWRKPVVVELDQRVRSLCAATR